MAKRKATERDHWIEDLNPFNLPKPPDWWLRYMVQFDSDLYIMPSRRRPVYNLMRPARLSGGIGPLSLTDREGDLTAMRRLGMVPSAVVLPASSGVWTTNVFDVDLFNRDIWRHGGPEKFSDELERREKAAEEKLDKQIIDGCLVRRRDMARSFKARTGQRTKLPAIKPKRGSKVLGRHQSPTTDGPRIVLATS